MVYWAKRSCDPDAEIPFMKLVGDLQLKLGAPHELMMLGSHPLTHKGYEVFIGVPQRELLALFDGFTEIQENELPDKECKKETYRGRKRLEPIHLGRTDIRSATGVKGARCYRGSDASAHGQSRCVQCKQ
jgi:hypothetical protein